MRLSLADLPPPSFRQKCLKTRLSLRGMARFAPVTASELVRTAIWMRFPLPPRTKVPPSRPETSDLVSALPTATPSRFRLLSETRVPQRSNTLPQLLNSCPMTSPTLIGWSLANRLPLTWERNSRDPPSWMTQPSARPAPNSLLTRLLASLAPLSSYLTWPP